jgi:phage shock protein C
MAKTLYRNPHDAMLGGVCSGLGDYFGVDANIVRLLFVILAVAPGIGIPAYLLLWLLLPEASRLESTTIEERVRDGAGEIAGRARSLGEEIQEKSRSVGPSASLAVGVVLIAVGIGFLLRNLGFTWITWLGRAWVWPSILIIVGLALLWRWIRERTS